MQCIEQAGPSKMPQDRSNCLHQKRRTVQVAACAQLFLSNDTLQLFGNEDMSASA